MRQHGFGRSTDSTFAKSLTSFPYYLGVYLSVGSRTVHWLTAEEAASW